MRFVFLTKTKATFSRPVPLLPVLLAMGITRSTTLPMFAVDESHSPDTKADLTNLSIEEMLSVKASSAHAILESSVQMGHAPGMSVIAGVVETREDWDLLSTVGCGEMQG